MGIGEQTDSASRTRRAPKRRLIGLVVGLVLLNVFCMTGAAFSSAVTTTNRLPNGQKLYGGHCIYEGSGSRKASFCVNKQRGLNLWYGSTVCWSFQAGGHVGTPDDFVKVAPNGQVNFWTYSGGQLMWHSNTAGFTGADLVVGSLPAQASLNVDTGTAFFPFIDCNHGLQAAADR